MKSLVRLGAVVAVSVLAAVGLSTSAMAASYDGAGLSLGSTSVAPGGSLTVRGDGFAGGSQVTIELHSAPIVLGSVTTDAAGAFVTTVNVPKAAPSGQHAVWAVGTAADGTPRVLKTPVGVGNLPFTGAAAIVPLGVIGGLAVAVGGGMVFLRRRNG